jgi:hypothetical protein
MIDFLVISSTSESDATSIKPTPAETSPAANNVEPVPRPALHISAPMAPNCSSGPRKSLFGNSKSSLLFYGTLPGPGSLFTERFHEKPQIHAQDCSMVHLPTTARARDRCSAIHLHTSTQAHARVCSVRHFLKVPQPRAQAGPTRTSLGPSFWQTSRLVRKNPKFLRTQRVLSRSHCWLA